MGDIRETIDWLCRTDENERPFQRAFNFTEMPVPQPICMGLLVLEPLQMTVTVPVPGRVEEPMLQVHETIPLKSATLGDNPCAVDRVPAGVT